MTITVGFTGEEIRELVYEYCGLRQGLKGPWLDAHPNITARTMGRWRRAVFDGDVDRRLVPRQTGPMNPKPAALRAALEQRSVTGARHDEELAIRDARIRELEETNDVLGKAIGLLHARNGSEPDETQTTNGPLSS